MKKKTTVKTIEKVRTVISNYFNNKSHVAYLRLGAIIAICISKWLPAGELDSIRG